MEATELDTNAQITSQMFPKNINTQNVGVVSGRTLAFTKFEDTSKLRITWTTNLRVYSASQEAYCSWEMLIDGQSCSTPSKLYVSLNSMPNEQDHIPVEMTGWCENIAAGSHTLTINVSQGNSEADCYTGWETNEYMEVWEPSPEERSYITYLQQGVSTIFDEDNSAALMTMTFEKQSVASTLRILYFDNFRVVGNGRWCRWEVKIDGASCPAPLAASVHTYNGENDHHPGTVLGECDGIADGSHALSIAVSGNGDCRTSWESHTLIEVQEEMP